MNKPDAYIINKLATLLTNHKHIDNNKLPQLIKYYSTNVDGYVSQRNKVASVLYDMPMSYKDILINLCMLKRMSVELLCSCAKYILCIINLYTNDNQQKGDYKYLTTVDQIDHYLLTRDTRKLK